MDAQAWQIRELVCSACDLIARVEERRGELAAAGELEHLRGRLLALAEFTGDDEAQDAAFGAVADIDATLRRFDEPVQQRGAA